MKIEWNEDKNKLLKTTRGICFEQVAEEINNHRYAGPEDNPAREGQKLLDYENATEEERKKFQDYAFWNSPLDEEEQWYEDHFDEFVPVKNQKEMREKLEEAAKNTMKEIENKKMITMRLEGNDITRLKEEAKNQGLPYQSLIGSILHKYLNGTLVDIGEAKKVLSFQVK